jgi:FAD/FMN-containing dehydrogenase
VVNGSIVMDLHRMNKVLEVNEKFCYAVVEPGITFGDLYNYCAERKLKVWPSTASLGWGSVVGNVSGAAIPSDFIFMSNGPCADAF